MYKHQRKRKRTALDSFRVSKENAYNSKASQDFIVYLWHRDRAFRRELTKVNILVWSPVLIGGKKNRGEHARRGRGGKQNA